MRLEPSRIWIKPTSDPLQFLMGVRINWEIAKAANLSRAGMAFTCITKDELMALIGNGFKPFAQATLEVDFHEFNVDGQSALTFDLKKAEFKGGMGSWDTLLRNMSNCSVTPSDNSCVLWRPPPT